MLIRYLIITVLFVFVSACSNNLTREPIVESAIESTVEPSLELEAAAVKESAIHLPSRRSQDTLSGSDNAVDQLLVGANKALANQQLARAGALVERAVRLAPQDPRGYYSLAQIRCKQNRFDQADLLLEKSLFLVNDDQLLFDAIKKFRASIK